MKPGNIRNHYFEKYLQSMVLNLTVYVRNIISFSYKQKEKNGEITIFRIFLAKNLILAYISLKTTKLGKIGNYDVIVLSYTGYLYGFGLYGKRRPIAILWCQISIPQAFIFQVHRGLQQPPWLVMLQKIA